MADRNTRIRKGQVGDASVEPIDLDNDNEGNTGNVPSIGEEGQFHWIIPYDETKEGFNEGALSEPTIIDASGLNINVSSIDVLIRSDINFPDYLYKFTVPQADVEVTDNSLNYIYVDYNSGSPIYKSTINRDDINNSNHIPVSRVYIKEGNIEYKLFYGYMGRSSSIRNFDRVMRTRGNAGEEKESGLAMSETATRIVNITSGYVWLGNNRISLNALVMGETGTISHLYYHITGGIWEKDEITQYDNLHYDNGTGLVELLPNRYVVNWVFRNLATDEIDIVLGTGDYTEAQATSSQIPAVPTEIANFYILVGRIIVKKSADTAYAIETTNHYTFQGAIITIHNDLSGLNEGDYVHLTSTEKSDVDDAVSKKHSQNTDTGTSSNDFTIGDGIDNDKSISANNGDANKPKIRYNSTTNKWQYSNNGVDFIDIGTSSGATQLDELTDVEFDSGTPTDEQVLTYDDASGKWKAKDPTGAVDSVNGQTGDVNLIADDMPTDESGISVQDHIDAIDNPHSVTKAQIGLTNVTNDLQLKEDISSYDEKTTPVDDDYLLLEDSEETGTPIKKVKKSKLGGITGDNVDNFTILYESQKLKIADRIEQNIMLLAFYRAVDQSKSIYNLVDGFIDEYEDETGIDTVNSINESYDSSNDLYSPAKSVSKEIDYMEYATDILARSAYVSSDGDIIDEYTKLLIHFNGTDGQQSYTTEDAGERIVTFANTAQLDDAQKKFGTTSLQVDGDSDYVTIPDSDDWTFGTGDFTIDFWIRFGTFKAQDIIGQLYQSNPAFLWGFWYTVSNRFTFSYIIDDSTIANMYTDPLSLSTNTWYHIAFVRNGSTPLLFINGISQSLTITTAFGNLVDVGSAPLKIGAGEIQGYLQGHLDEVRISKGIARWTENFAVPTEEYSIVIQGNLDVYSENAIKQQGSYSLKGIAKITDSLNDTLTKTLETASHIDLSDYDSIKFYVRSSRTGTNLQLKLHDSGGTTSTYNIAISSTNTWEQKTWDISGISNANKDDIDSIIIEVTNADAENTFYLDDMYAEGETQNMTLISNDITAEAEPSQARIVIFEEDVDAITINTDLKAFSSIDDGSTWAEITLEDFGDWETGKRILSGIVDVSSESASEGRDVRYKLTTHNNKDCKIHGTAMSWA